jgi:VWFA-related protein
MVIGLLLVAPLCFGDSKETITVNFVEVPVNVTDRSGNPIRGLKAANFEVIDDGKPRQITGFDAVDFSSKESVEGSSPVSPAARHNFLLLFDLSFSSPNSVKRAQEAARDFVTKLAARRDLIAVATVDVNHGFHLLTAFTTDRGLIGAAVSDLKSFRGFDPLRIAGAPFDPEVLATANEPAAGGRAGDEMADIAAGLDRQHDAYNRDNIERQVNMIAEIAQTLRAVKGQKHVVLLSDGFDPRLVQGRDAGSSEQQTKETLAVERGEIWNVQNDNRYGSSESMSLVNRMAAIAKKSDVILDAIDTHGLRSQLDARNGLAKTSNEGLHLLADVTGGTVFKNTNDLAVDFKRFLHTQEVVYVLGFNGSSSSPGKFHNLKVRLVDVPGGRTTARTGYYEPGHGTEAERLLSTAEVIVNDVPQNAIHIDALTTAFPADSHAAQVPVILEINGADLLRATKDAKSLTVEVAIYAFDSDGAVHDSVFQRLVLDQDKVGNSLRASGIKYYATLRLAPGTYAIKMLVRVPESETKGYARRDVIVPLPEALAVSQPIFFDTAQNNWLMIKGGTRDKDKTKASYPFAINGESFLPSAAARITPGTPQKFAVFVYNATPDEMTIETSPKASVLQRLQSGNNAKMVFQLDTVDSSVSAVDVTVHKKGVDGATKASVPILH